MGLIILETISRKHSERFYCGGNAHDIKFLEEYVG